MDLDEPNSLVLNRLLGNIYGDDNKGNVEDGNDSTIKISKLHLDRLRDKGAHKCGYTVLKPSMTNADVSSPLVAYEEEPGIVRGQIHSTAMDPN
jgi:hypothetical protein